MIHNINEQSRTSAIFKRHILLSDVVARLAQVSSRRNGSGGDGEAAEAAQTEAKLTVGNPISRGRTARLGFRWKEAVAAAVAVPVALLLLRAVFFDDGAPLASKKKAGAGKLLLDDPAKPPHLRRHEAARRLEEIGELLLTVLYDDAASDALLDELAEIESIFKPSADKMAAGLAGRAAEMRAAYNAVRSAAVEAMREHGFLPQNWPSVSPEIWESALLLFGNAKYWSERYEKQVGQTFDWYGAWDDTADDGRTVGATLLTRLGPPLSRILVVGAGNSEMSKRLFDSGYTNLVSTDISESVIRDMKSRHPEIEWRTMDATKMPYENATFDFVIDKGTFDALHLWTWKASEGPSAAARQGGNSLRTFVEETFRVLKPDGAYIMLSHSNVSSMESSFLTERCTVDVLAGTTNRTTVVGITNRSSSRWSDRTSEMLVYLHHCPSTSMDS